MPEDTDPTAMKTIRRQEFERAMGTLGLGSNILDWGDLALSLQPREPVIRSVLEIVREKRFDVLFSFHPQEVTVQVDHPDHQLAGTVTGFVGATADVSWFMSDIPASSRRPELYYWTTDTEKATHRITLTGESASARENYAASCYPSQFPEQSRGEWSAIFSKVADPSSTGQQTEFFAKVR